MAELINECKYVKQTSYYIYHKTLEHALKRSFGIFTLV